MHTAVKNIILSFIVFIRHSIYIQIKQNGTHQSMMFHNVQALLDMLQCSHNFHILILFVMIRDKEIDNLFGSVLPFKQFAYTNKTQLSMFRQSSLGKTTRLH